MTYSEFLNTLISPIRLFISAIIQVADSLIHNYIFITILGLTMFISLFWFLFNFIHDYFSNKINDYYDYYDKKKNYELYKQIQYDYLDNYKDLEFAYRLKNLKLNRFVYGSYLTLYSDSEKSYRLASMIINKEVSSQYMKDFKWEDINNRLLAINNKRIVNESSITNLSSDEKINVLANDVANVFADYQDIDLNNNNINHLSNKKNKYNVIYPKWLDDKQSIIPPSEEEINEMNKLLKKNDISKPINLSKIYDKHYVNVDTGEVYLANDKGYIQYNNLMVNPINSNEFNVLDDINK